MRPSVRRLVRAAHVVLLLLFAGLLVLFRAEAAVARPAVLAGVVVALVFLYAFELTIAVRRRDVPAALLAGGALLIFGAGLANWLFGLQGYVLLTEREGVPLTAATHMQAFAAGPLSNAQELSSTLQLEKVELLPSADGFSPASRLLIDRGDGVKRVEIAPGRAATAGTLRLYQGAFGFSPRIVITRNGRTLFDRVVPFTTSNRGGRLVSFDGAFDVAREHLSLRGGIDLRNLDEAMKGHPRLGLEVRHDGRLLGRGELLPGHFATLADGYAVGFAGLTRWSEIDVSRRNYPEPMYAGAAFVMAGVAALFWRRR